MKEYKLFCTVDMNTYYVCAETSYDARRKLAMDLMVPLSCIDIFDD